MKSCDQIMLRWLLPLPRTLSALKNFTIRLIMGEPRFLLFTALKQL